MVFWAFGDSFILGDQDDFGPGDCNYKPELWKDHGMSYDQRIQWCKGVSFARTLAGDNEYRNCAERGAGNYTSLDLVYSSDIGPGDTVLFGISSTTRDRLRTLGHREAQWIMHPLVQAELITVYDQRTIVGALEAWARLRGFKLILVNTFDANGSGARTLVDILLDRTPGTPGSMHTDLLVPPEYQHLFTWNGHPSVLGHQKLAQWFLDNELSA